MSLSNLACKDAKVSGKPLKLADSGGLFLHVMPNGSKYWRQKYRFGGKEKLLSLGGYPTTSLDAFYSTLSQDERPRNRSGW